jgi:hypothetical protein
MTDFDSFASQWRSAASDFAVRSYADFERQAVDDALTFFNKVEQDLHRWTSMLGDGSKGTLTKDDFTSLVNGERDLLELNALKQAGLAEARWDLFTEGLLDLTVQTAAKVFL